MNGLRRPVERAPNNGPSLATIARLGFVRIGERIDEIDGLEWVHALDL